MNAGGKKAGFKHDDLGFWVGNAHKLENVLTSMSVEELIERLKRLDPRDEVYFRSAGATDYVDRVEVGQLNERRVVELRSAGSASKFCASRPVVRPVVVNPGSGSIVG